jgi:hypothetical protein
MIRYQKARSYFGAQNHPGQKYLLNTASRNTDSHGSSSILTTRFSISFLLSHIPDCQWNCHVAPSAHQLHSRVHHQIYTHQDHHLSVFQLHTCPITHERNNRESFFKNISQKDFLKQILLQTFQVAQQIAAKSNIHIGSLPGNIVLIQSQNCAYEFDRVV